MVSEDEGCNCDHPRSFTHFLLSSSEVLSLSTWKGDRPKMHGCLFFEMVFFVSFGKNNSFHFLLSAWSIFCGACALALGCHKKNRELAGKMIEGLLRGWWWLRISIRSYFLGAIFSGYRWMDRATFTWEVRKHNFRSDYNLGALITICYPPWNKQLALKINGWKIAFPFGDGLFSRVKSMLVSGRVPFVSGIIVAD